MDLSKVKDIIIPEGSVAEVAIDGVTVWRKSKLPVGYTECEYLETTGTQYLRTGIQISPTIGVHTQFVVSSTLQDIALIGCLVPDTYLPYQTYGVTPYNNAFRFAIGTAEAIGPVYKPVIGTRYDVKYNINKRLYVNDEEAIRTINITRQGELTMGYRGVQSVRYSRFRYEMFDVYDGEDIVLSFIPCLDDKGRPCMYDTVSKQPFYNDGVDEFKYSIK